MMISEQFPEINSGCCILANRIGAAEVCDARDDDQGTEVDNKKNLLLYFACCKSFCFHKNYTDCTNPFLWL